MIENKHLWRNECWKSVWLIKERLEWTEEWNTDSLDLLWDTWI